MRKPVAAAVALTALVMPSSALAAAPVGHLTATLTKNSLTLDIQTTTADGSAPPASTAAAIRLGQGVSLDPFDSPVCPALGSCAQSSQVGTGGATGQLPGVPPPTNKLPAGVTAYNGSPPGTLDLQLSGASSASFSGSVSPDVAPYVAKLVVPSLPVLPGPTGHVALTDFNTTIGGGNPGAIGSRKTTTTTTVTRIRHRTVRRRIRRRGHLVVVRKRIRIKKRVRIATTKVTPTQYVSVSSCSAPGIPFEAIVTYEGGAITVADAVAPCPTS